MGFDNRQGERPVGRRKREQVVTMLNAEELAAVDDFRFRNRLPSRSAAVRELIKVGLSVPTPQR